MAADRHSRLVGWLKVALPLAALAILSSLFLLADRIDPDAALPYAEVDVETLAREPRMTAPSYAGTTEDGASLTLSAEEARPATTDAPARAEGVRLDLATPDGGTTQLRAATARLDQASGQVVLSGGVTVETSTGYRLQTDEVVGNLDRSRLVSRGAVTAEGPAGELQAGGMELGQDNRTPGAYVLVFNRGVRLVYRPGG
jgi:lipopolysaccharide export system protein LptC